jgi:heat shock protein HslJ
LAIASVALDSSPSAIAQNDAVRPGISREVAKGHGSPASQLDNDISELRDTFWHLKQLRGSTTNVSGTVVSIILRVLTTDGARGAITFSTPAYFISLPLFVDKAKGLEFSPAYAHGGMVEDGRFPQDQQIGQIFESELQKTCCYELSSDILTFRDRDQHSTIVLSPVRQNGIENRRWRIARYHGDENNSTQKDELIDASEQADVVFMNGRVYGSSGCGGWAGTYVVSGDNLASDVGAFLGGLCSSAQFAQGPMVEKALKGDRRIEQKDDHILLRDISGKAQILLVPF